MGGRCSNSCRKYCNATRRCKKEDAHGKMIKSRKRNIFQKNKLRESFIILHIKLSSYYRQLANKIRERQQR